MYMKPIMNELREHATIVGVYDINSVRAQIVREQCGGTFPIFRDFDDMLEQTKPDAVIVTTVDSTHHEYIIRSMEAGCDVIVEKPITTDEEKCKRILEAEKRTGRKIVVTFNYRFVDYNTKLKQIIKEGTLGKIYHIDFELGLDMVHGASYFRRWHSEKEKSGTLLVHKATHYFDLFNWWIDDEPREVFARGGLHYYGPNRTERGERCATCDYQQSCEYYWDINKDQTASTLYQQAEKEDGYIRDRCVFSDKVNIYDTMAVMVNYKKGATLNFSLNAHCPFEYWKMSIHGEKGKLEAEEFRTGENSIQPYEQIRFYDRNGGVVKHNIKVPTYSAVVSGLMKYTQTGHKGGDKIMNKYLFIDGTKDPLERMADSRAGIISALTGIAAYRSIEQNKVIEIEDLLK